MSDMIWKVLALLLTWRNQSGNLLMLWSGLVSKSTYPRANLKFLRINLKTQISASQSGQCAVCVRTLTSQFDRQNYVYGPSLGTSNPADDS